MTSPRHHVAKVYEAVTEEDIPAEAVELFAPAPPPCWKSWNRAAPG